MTFEYQSKIYLGEVALYVADLARQRDVENHIKEPISVLEK